jgi:Na+/phosphate symporter
MPQNRCVRVDGFGKARTVNDKLEALTNAVEEQQLTADEACKLASLLDLAIKVEQHGELRERLEQLEQANKIGVDDDGFKQEVEV